MCRVQSSNCSLYRDESLHGNTLIWMCYLKQPCTGAAPQHFSRAPTEPAALTGGSSSVRDCTPLGEGAIQSHNWKNKFSRLDSHTTLYPASAGCVCLTNDQTSLTLSLLHPKPLPSPKSSLVEAQAERTGPSLFYLHKWDVASALMKHPKTPEIKVSAEYTYQGFNKRYFNLFGNAGGFREEKEVTQEAAEAQMLKNMHTLKRELEFWCGDLT